MEDINQRIQEFYNTIHYTVEPDTGLSNGDTITVKAQYDEALAQQYHFEPENTVKEIVVEGLPNRFDSVTQIDTAWIGQIEREMERYIEEHKGQEIETEFTQIDPREATLESTTLEYAGFLKSMEAQHGDRFIGIVPAVVRHRAKAGGHVLYRHRAQYQRLAPNRHAKYLWRAGVLERGGNRARQIYGLHRPDLWLPVRHRAGGA